MKMPPPYSQPRAARHETPPRHAIVEIPPPPRAAAAAPHNQRPRQRAQRKTMRRAKQTDGSDTGAERKNGKMRRNKKKMGELVE